MSDVGNKDMSCMEMEKKKLKKKKLKKKETKMLHDRLHAQCVWRAAICVGFTNVVVSRSLDDFIHESIFQLDAKPYP